MSRHPYDAPDPDRAPDAATTVGHHPYAPVPPTHDPHAHPDTQAPGTNDPYAYRGAQATGDDDPYAYRGAQEMGDDGPHAYRGGQATGDDGAYAYRGGQEMGDDDPYAYRGAQESGDEGSYAYRGGQARGDDGSAGYTAGYDDAGRYDDVGLDGGTGGVDGAGYDPGADLWDEHVPEAAGRRRLRPVVVAAAVLALVVTALAAVTVPSYLDLRAARAAEAAGAAALKAARAYVPELMSYDYRTVGADFARARARTTGSLTDYYRRLEATLGPVIRQRRTVQRVEVRGAAVESAAPGRAEVLILLNRTTTTTPPGAKAPKREVATGRARLVLTKTDKSDKTGSTWLVSDLTTLLGSVPPAL